MVRGIVAAFIVAVGIIAACAAGVAVWWFSLFVVGLLVVIWSS